MTVRDIDKGWKHFVASVSEFAKHDVIVGWIEGKKENRDGDAGITNAGLAAVHEFGTNDGTIPEGRLGFREWQDMHSSKIADEMQAAYVRTVKGADVKRELNKLGLWAVSDWRKYQREVQPGPEIGIAREKQIIKAHGKTAFFKSKKLVDTGQLVNGATHVVRRRVGG
jgi:hypothetical protein